MARCIKKLVFDWEHFAVHACFLCPNPPSLKCCIISYCPWPLIVSLSLGLPFPITSCSKPFLLFSVLCLRELIWRAIPTITPSLPSPKHISLFLGSSVSQLKGVMLITVIMCIYGKHNPQLRKLPVLCKKYYWGLSFIFSAALKRFSSFFMSLPSSVVKRCSWVPTPKWKAIIR